MATKRKMFTPWSSLDNMLGKPPSWWPVEEQARIQAYEKYDQMYWNDPTQYAIRVLENEQPIYVPNARIIVDTTSQYLMKGLQIIPKGGAENQVLTDFFKRERFYSKFTTNKKAGITRGDWAFHITADPMKPEGSRVSIDTLHPGQVWRVSDPDDPDKIIRIHIAELYVLPNDESKTEYVRRLTYEKVQVGQTQRISREEAVFKLVPEWYGPKPEKVKTILPKALLPEQITQFPVYWYPNIEWESQLYGSSDLRGLEFLEWAVSQGATDTQMALGLEGLGVYATDGGRPVDDQGNEGIWEVSPGKVMEVPSGSYFRRVEGVGSVTPMMDQLSYLEKKMYAAAGLTDVALGQVDVQVASSGVALAIKFMPTLARIEDRDTAGVEITQQMMYDLQAWFLAYERGLVFPEVEVKIAESKLPKQRVETLNELNNMLDRKIISKKFYRSEMQKLGYAIPADIDTEIAEEKKAEAELAVLTAPAPLQQNAEDAAAGRKPITNANGGNNENVDNSANRSNNRNRPNESSGTEAGQTAQRQSKS